jgi:hypothetical protein
MPHRLLHRRINSRPGSGLHKVDLSKQRACVSRLYFKVPGGIQTGQHYLQVMFAESVLQVPFRILTEDGKREFNKKWKDIKKEHDEELKQQQQD